MPDNTYHVTASGESFVHVGDNYQSGDAQRGKLLNRLLPNWQLNKSLELHWDHDQARQKHLGKTCDWIFEAIEFQSWILETNGVIWLHGLTGCGKTVLSSTIIDYLRRSLSQDSSYIAGYYFNAKEGEKRKATRLMRSVILQLLPTKGKLPPQIDQLCNDVSQEISEHQLLIALESLVDRKEHTYVVIDALDECDTTYRSGEDSEVDKLESFLRFLITKSQNLHLLVTSRDGGLESKLEAFLRKTIASGQEDDLPHYEFDLQSINMKKKVGHDISTLVTSEVKRWKDRRGRRRWLPLNNDQQSLVIDSVKERANGMFRLAACLLDLLWRKDSWEDVKLALNDLPAELFEVYDRIFQEIDGEGQLATANNLLKWILYSERPLRLAELIEITMADNQGTSFSIGRRAQDRGYVSLTLSSFITISEDEIVQFAHQTVQEYLLSANVQCGLFSHRSDCSGWIARCCLSYIHFCANDPDVEGPIRMSFRERLPLLEYVFNNWSRHFVVLFIGTMEDDSVFGKVVTVPSGHPSGVFSMAAGGISDREHSQRLLSQWTFEVNLWLDEISLHGNVPHFDIFKDIICQGYERCIRFLIIALKLAIPKGSSFQNHILKAAIAGRYRELIQMLVDGEFKGWDKASQWTATAQDDVLKHNSHEAIVKVLLEQGVNANSRDSEDGWTPLHIAAFQGDEGMIELLLNHGAFPGTIDFNGRTPLHVASSRGHEVIVRLWLDKGLPIDTKDNMGWTALDRLLQGAAMEVAAQHLPDPAKATPDSLAAEYSGTLEIPQFRERNCRTIARTMELLLSYKASREKVHIERRHSIDEESTEHAFSDGTQFSAGDQDYLIPFRGTANEIKVTDGRLRLGFSLMERLVNKEVHHALYPLPLVEPLPLRRWPRRHSMNLVNRVHIYGGAVDLRWCYIGSLIVCGGTTHLTMATIHAFELEGGFTLFSTPPRICRLVMSGGSVVFQDCFSTSSSRPDHSTPTASPQSWLSMAGRSSGYPKSVQIKGFILNEGVAKFLAPVEVDNLVLHGGTIIFLSKVKVKNMVLYGGSVTFAEEFYLNNMVIYHGYSNCLAIGEVNNLVLYQGCAIFAAGSRVRIMVMYGGYSNFLSAAEVYRIVQHGGRIDFLQNIQRELFELLYDGVSAPGAVDESTAMAAVHIQELVVYGGLFNYFAKREPENMEYFGGDVFLNFDGVICVLAACGQVDLARTLLKQGASPLQASSRPRLLTGLEVEGWTALHEAAFEGQEAFVRMLLEQRTHLLLQEGSLLTVDEIAALQGHTSIVRLLHSVNIQEDERTSPSNEDKGVFERLARRIYYAFQSLLR